MRDHIHNFVRYAVDKSLSFYNENTLQMELALFLRLQRPELSIHLERPITDFGARESGGKKEIDISVLDPDSRPLFAIEIKMPNNGRVPESMFDYCRDIRFCESLVSVGFKSAYAFILTRDRAFRSGREIVGIYKHFRAGVPVTGTIRKPTGARDKEVTLCGTYSIEWHTNYAGFAYAITEITKA